MSANDCLTLLIRPEWWNEAACLGMKPENFFIDELDPDYGDKIAIAKRICASCTVREKCYEYAKSNKEEFGVWAGINVEEEGFSW